MYSFLTMPFFDQNSSFALIGFYPSVQGLLAQFCYLALVALIVLFDRPKQPNTI